MAKIGDFQSYLTFYREYVLVHHKGAKSIRVPGTSQILTVEEIKAKCFDELVEHLPTDQEIQYVENALDFDKEKRGVSLLVILEDIPRRNQFSLAGGINV